MIPLILLSVFASSLLGTALVRLYALRRQLLDVPNDRSSHSEPTPRGGGLAIAAAVLLGIAVLSAGGRLPLQVALAVGVPGAVVAAVGFLDDHSHVAPGWRLLAHSVAVTAGLLLAGGLAFGPEMGAAFTLLQIGGAVALVWLVNLYNFMDGIDGIAAVEALTVGAAGGVLAVVGGLPEASLALPLLVAAAAAGFLVWNFPPARIFMGDVGSGFLGAALGFTAVVAARDNPSLAWGWMILLGVFIVDATLTLLRRILSGLRPHEAHRTHAYQRLSRRLGEHRAVTLLVAAVNIFWLLPWAAAVAMEEVRGPVALAIAYLPLLAVTFRLGAGTESP